jgi:hypoxanthine phosphoribosyltransferase
MYVINSYDVEKKGDINLISRPDIDYEGRKILIIDDMSDSGSTIKFVRDDLIQHYQVNESNIKIAAIVYRTGSEIRPDFFGVEVDRWVVFPWEPKEKGYWGH